MAPACRACHDVPSGLLPCCMCLCGAPSSSSSSFLPASAALFYADNPGRPASPLGSMRAPPVHHTSTKCAARCRYYGSDWRRDTAGLPGGFMAEGGVHFVAALRLLARGAGTPHFRPRGLRIWPVLAGRILAAVGLHASCSGDRVGESGWHSMGQQSAAGPLHPALRRRVGRGGRRQRRRQQRAPGPAGPRHAGGRGAL